MSVQVFLKIERYYLSIALFFWVATFLNLILKLTISNCYPSNDIKFPVFVANVADKWIDR